MKIKEKIQRFIENLDNTSELIYVSLEVGTGNFGNPQLTLVFQNYDGKEYHLTLEINETK